MIQLWWKVFSSIALYYSADMGRKIGAICRALEFILCIVPFKLAGGMSVKLSI